MKRGEFVRIEKILMFSIGKQHNKMMGRAEAVCFFKFTQWFSLIEPALYDT